MRIIGVVSASAFLRDHGGARHERLPVITQVIMEERMWAHVRPSTSEGSDEMTDFAMDKVIMKVCVFERDVTLCFESLSCVVLFRDCVNF